MTATAPRTDIPDFNGEEVDRVAIKFTGVGTGFTGLDVRPIVMELDDEAYFIVKASAAESASHFRDKKHKLVRLQRVRAEDMAPIDAATAQKALRSYAQEIEKIKAETMGQTSIDDELAASEREAKDGSAPAAEVAKDSADRVKRGQ